MNEQIPEPARPLQGESFVSEPEVESKLALARETDAAFTPGKIFGVALLGAFSSLLAYYAYHQLEAETRDSIKRSAFSMVKGQVRNFIGSDD